MNIITPIYAVKKTNCININNNQNIKLNTIPQQDKISFSGLVIRPTKNKHEIDALVNLFYNTYTKNTQRRNNLPYLLKIFNGWIIKHYYKSSAKSKYSLTEVIKDGNKLAGGYSLAYNPFDHSAHLGFLTLAPEYMKTKSGVTALKNIGNRIYNFARKNDLQQLSWVTNSKNKQINNLLERFHAEKIAEFENNSEYLVSIKKFGEELEKIKI